MGLFEEVRKNTNLIYIDDTDNGKEYRFCDLPFIELDESATKQIAFLYLDNSLQAISVFWSFIKSKHTIALLSPNLSEGFKNDLEDLYNPSYIYDTTRYQLENYILKSFNTKISLYFRVSKLNTILVNDNIKLLLSTSGTTGSPKFVKLSENNILSNAFSIINYLPINNSDVTPLNLPIYYSYGLSILTTNSIKGGKIVCSNVDILNRAFWSKMSSYNYTSIAGVPFVYEMLERIGFRKNIYPSLRYFTVAGGKLDNTIMKDYAEYALANLLDFFVMYGQTEATARMSFVPPNRLLDKIGSIGIPIKDGIFELDNDNGELCYSGPNVFGGYVNQPSDLALYLQPELLHTGDLARVDSEGFYYVTGRMKRFVKLFGNRINLDEVEVIAASHVGITVKCVGINDQMLLMALIDDTIDAESLKKYVSERIKIHHSVLKVIFINEYPFNQNGKIDYNKIISLHATN